MPNRIEVDLTELRASFEERRRKMDMKLGLILDRVGERTVELLQSYTGERKKDGRLMHPGGWADKTHNLVNNYGYQVDHDTGRWRLTILNTARHAHLIEERDGIFVVRGIADPGGPVDMAFRQAVREFAPEWELTA